jgi:hypothetical protein
VELVWENDNPTKMYDFEQHTKDDLYGFRALEPDVEELCIEQVLKVLELNGNPKEAECNRRVQELKPMVRLPLL